MTPARAASLPERPDGLESSSPFLPAASVTLTMRLRRFAAAAGGVDVESGPAAGLAAVKVTGAGEYRRRHRDFQRYGASLARS